VLVTFDDAYVDLLTVGSPLLAERGIPAVAFVVGSEIGGTNTWDNRKGMRSLPLLDADGLRSLVAKGIAVGAHGWTHRPLIDLDPDELVQELQDTMQRLADLGLPRPAALAYPYGSTNERVAAAVEAAGYKVAFTVTPGALDSAASAFTLPRVEVLHDDTPKHLRVKIATAAWPQAFRDRALQLSRLLGN
jgi:peptidoglycan/xylan/chitin deacetylase (PgdA/CDA1 family)